MLYFKNDKIKLYNADCLDILKNMPENSIDAVVVDPPYGIAIIDNQWDKDLKRNPLITFKPETWKAHLRVLKPGGYLVCFADALTYHKTASAIETGGFLIRDQLIWLQNYKMPRSQNIAKFMDKELGYKGKIIGERVHRQKNGMYDKRKANIEYIREHHPKSQKWAGWFSKLKGGHEPIVLAQKPMEKMIWDYYIYPKDAVLHHRSSFAKNTIKWKVGGLNIFETSQPNRYTSNILFNDTELPEILRGSPKFWYTIRADADDRTGGIGGKPENNNHATVKPTDLMMWLVRLITPAGGVVLDSFMGSGSTGKAVTVENLKNGKDYEFIGIEKEAKYLQLARDRITKGASFYYQKTVQNGEHMSRENDGLPISIFDILRLG